MFSFYLSYVALSRFRTLNRLHLIDFDGLMLYCKENAFGELKRLTAKYKPGANVASMHCNRKPPCLLALAMERQKQKKKIPITRKIMAASLKEVVGPASSGGGDFSGAYVPLINERNVCYCNSLMQCLLQLRCLETAICREEIVDSQFV